MRSTFATKWKELHLRALDVGLAEPDQRLRTAGGGLGKGWLEAAKFLIFFMSQVERISER